MSTVHQDVVAVAEAREDQLDVLSAVGQELPAARVEGLVHVPVDHLQVGAVPGLIWGAGAKQVDVQGDT